MSAVGMEGPALIAHEPGEGVGGALPSGGRIPTAASALMSSRRGVCAHSSVRLRGQERPLFLGGAVSRGVQGVCSVCGAAQTMTRGADVHAEIRDAVRGFEAAGPGGGRLLEVY